jgi:hypothetical protein
MTLGCRRSRPGLEITERRYAARALRPTATVTDRLARERRGNHAHHQEVHGPLASRCERVTDLVSSLSGARLRMESAK